MDVKSSFYVILGYKVKKMLPNASDFAPCIVGFNGNEIRLRSIIGIEPVTPNVKN